MSGLEMTPKTMSSPTLLGELGKSYYPISMLGRLPFAMTVVGVFTLVVSVTGSYSDAGLTSATVGVGTAIFGPILGIAADKYGQRSVLLASMLVHGLALVAVTALTYAHVHVASLVACAFIIGASAPQMAAMSRARLMTVIATRLPSTIRSKTLNKVMSIESMADELVFVFGPVAVGVLAPAVGPWSPVVVAAVITVVCVTAFALHKTSTLVAPISSNSKSGEVVPSASVREVFRPRIVVLALGMFCAGWFFGSMYTGLTSFMDDRGLGESTGVVYAALGAGSAVLALAVVVFPAGFKFAYRWLGFALVGVAGAVFVPFVTEIWQMVVVLIVMGIGLGPVLVTLFSLASHRAPHGRSATVMTLLSSSVVVGQSISTALMGQIIDAHGTAPVLVVPALAMCALVAMSVWNLALSRKAAARGRDG